MKTFQEFINERIDIPYFWFKDGMIVDKEGKVVFNQTKPFKSINAARLWLKANDEKGNLKGVWVPDIQRGGIK